MYYIEYFTKQDSRWRYIIRMPVTDEYMPTIKALFGEYIEALRDGVIEDYRVLMEYEI